MDAEAKELQSLDPAIAAGSWDRFVRSFIDGYFEIHPTFAARAGRHDLDGRLPDWSPEAIEREIAWLRWERDRLVRGARGGVGLGLRFPRAQHEEESGHDPSFHGGSYIRK